MRLKSLLVVAATLLAGVPAASQATVLSITLGGIFQTGLGVCIDPGNNTNVAPDGTGRCSQSGEPGAGLTDIINAATDLDGPTWEPSGLYNADVMALRTLTVNNPANTTTLSQEFFFNAGLTGSGSAGAYPTPLCPDQVVVGNAMVTNPNAVGVPLVTTGGLITKYIFNQSIQIVTNTDTFNGSIAREFNLFVGWCVDGILLKSASLLNQVVGTDTVNITLAGLGPIFNDANIDGVNGFAPANLSLSNLITITSGPTAVPIASSLLLLGLGLAGLGFRRRDSA